MKRYGFLLLLFLLIGAAFSQPTFADTVYTYTGNPFNEFEGLTCPLDCAISGSFTVASPLPDNLALGLIATLAFSFTDGNITINKSSVFIGSGGVEVGTNSSGDVTSWIISFTVFPSFNFLQTTNQPGAAFDRVIVHSTGGIEFPRAANVSDPGVWTSTVAAPEPTSIGLMLLGIGLVFAMRKRTDAGLSRAS
jgi:hypothetical protein